MRRRILGFGFACMATSTLAAKAVPRLNPPIPPLESFKDCKPDANPGGFESIDICTTGKLFPADFGLPVDGDLTKRHAFWQLGKYKNLSEAKADNTYYSVLQYAFDCRLKKAVYREVYGQVIFSGRPAAYRALDIRKWTASDAHSSLDFMAANCPPRKGFVRLNNVELGVGYAIRSGRRVNVEAIFDDGAQGVYTVDCGLMTYGYNRQPSSPIKPRSVAHELYKRVCR